MLHKLAFLAASGLMIAAPAYGETGEAKAMSAETWTPTPLYAGAEDASTPADLQGVHLPDSVVPDTEESPIPAAQEVEPQVGQYDYPEVEPTYAQLGRRTPDGDWVTSRFEQPLVPREETRVAVLGYHNFSNSKRPTEMLMRTAEFCQQMQYIRDAGIAVISMQDFLEWRHGSRMLPARCVLITIDDGWKSVYTDAFPVLRAYGYPFTLFLYTRYINVRGASMTHEMIREMIQHGATIGSHSSNHLYPRDWKRLEAKPDAYHAQVVREIQTSGEKLRKLYGRCSTYCYPGGYHTPRMQAMLQQAGYSAAFTVLESKVECQEPAYEVHRYMVFGVNKEIFRRGVNFDGVPGVQPTREGIAAAEAPAKAFFPKAFEGIVESPPAKPKAPQSPAAQNEQPAPVPARPAPLPQAPPPPSSPPQTEAQNANA